MQICHLATLSRTVQAADSSSSAFYCVYREAFPKARSDSFVADRTGFTFAGLKFIEPDNYLNKYANRGPSAMLDYLVSADESKRIIPTEGTR
jgi:hypothetical protein